MSVNVIKDGEIKKIAGNGGEQENAVVSLDVRNIMVVSELPADADQHPEIVYIAPEK